MDMMRTVDIALGMVFVYLIFSLCVTALNESIAAALSSRARWLRKGITALLTPGGGDRPATARVDAVYQSPFISALGQGAWKTLQPRFAPSYIPAWTLVQGMLDAAGQGAAGALGTVAEVQAAVDRLPDRSPIKTVLEDLVPQAGGDLAKLKTLVEAWFKTFEDQVTAWYRQKTQYMLVLLSLGVAVVMNIDTLAMVRLLSQDAKASAALAALATRTAGGEEKALSLAPYQAAAQALAAARAQGVTGDGLAELEKKLGDELAAIDASVRSASAALVATGLPLGWQPREFETYWPQALGSGLPKTLGLLLSALALSLGAPFWFDLLQKLVSIRSVGKNMLERQQADKQQADQRTRTP